MKTNIVRLLLGICLSSPVLLTGCIDEVFPTSGATEDQISSSDKAAEAMLWAMPASLNVVGTIDKDRHWDWGYGSIMHIRDVMTGDMPVISSGYDWYAAWEENLNQGESMVYPQFLWNFYWKSVLAANKLLGALNAENATETQLGYMGAAYAFRAFYYLDMARMFEYLPCDVNPEGKNKAGNIVLNLTVPIVTEDMTETDARNNPRATREEMAKFILEDLNKAEEYIINLKSAGKTIPNLSVVYGLKARYYLWLEKYSEAQDYAGRAIAASGTSPMTEAQCLSTSKGFNDISCWMWGSQLVAEDDCVKTGILNWTSWMSNETSFGYSSQEPYLMMDASMYKRLNDTDFRKKMWKAPTGSTLDGETSFLPGFEDKLTEYASTKFRPAEGNPDDVNIGAVSAYPLMRVEEMYFIQAEAAARLNDATGRSLFNDFMTSYRDESYSTTASGEALIDEILFQKRVELWGEGQAFFDIKRANLSVTRGYEGTNFSDAVRFNTNGRPAWMNLSIVQTEKNNNKALIGWENPDPTAAYPVWR